MKKIFLFFLILVLSSCFVSAVPELPMIISGDATINEKPAKVGTEITAKIDDKEVNEVKITEGGKFTFLLQKLDENSLVKLYVDGIDAKVSVNYKSGDFQDLELAVEKSYLAYYIIGGLIALGASLLIWKRKN